MQTEIRLLRTAWPTAVFEGSGIIIVSGIALNRERSFSLGDRIELETGEHGGQAPAKAPILRYISGILMTSMCDALAEHVAHLR
jgi:hypothetical protein